LHAKRDAFDRPMLEALAFKDHMIDCIGTGEWFGRD
jgi:hypothetical protein